jgi:arylsulfatase A-like enzyme
MKQTFPSIRRFLGILALLPVLHVTTAQSQLSGAPAAPKPNGEGGSRSPNVILIMTDDQGYGDMSCHGHPWLNTPNLDQLHAESVRLTDFHASPLCSPTRATLLTGRHCRHVGLNGTNNGTNLISRETPTMANVFAQNGYRTGIFGKWHLGDLYPYRPIDRGFQEAIVHGDGAVTTVSDAWGNDYFDDRYWHNGKKTQYKGFCTDVWFNEATRFIKQSKASGKPFFCYIPTNIPHGPHYAPEEYIKMFEGQPHPAVFAALAHFDERVGRMRAILKESGLAENTIFIYCTDNGSPKTYAGGVYNAGMRGGKGSPYDGGHRVPGFIHWPAGKLTGGRDVDQLSAHLDILPTLVDLCQLETPENYRTDGVSLKPALEGTVEDLGDRVLVESFRSVVMTKRWRLVGDELYDMPADPAQKKDVAEAHPEVVSRLSAALREVEAKNDTRRQRIIIGSNKQNPSEFTPDAWSVMQRSIGFWQKGIARGCAGTAPILAEAETLGTYRFSLRRWPEEVNRPIRASAELTVPDGLSDETKTEQGQALPIVKARLKVADFDKTIEVTDDMIEATFTVPLKKGVCDILAQFITDDGKEYGAYFLYVERIKTRKNI